MVTFQSGDEKIRGFLASPGDERRHRAVIAIHEWWGLNDWAKERATNLAANGYIVLAVDLYRGKVTVNPSEARKLRRAVPDNRAIRDMKAAFNYLAARDDVYLKYIGSIGWSMGGAFAIQLAIHEPRLAACVVNYGVLPTDLVYIRKINAQVLGNFGAHDRGIPLAKVRAFEKMMKIAKKFVDIKIYDDAGHAFDNPNNKRGYRREAAVDAWSRTVRFFAQTKESNVSSSHVE
jgi:carboxymethylenebutenolidase